MGIKKQFKYFLTIIIMLISGTILYQSILFPAENKNRKIINEFPLRINEWSGKDVIYDRGILNVLKPDYVIYRNYFKEGSPPIGLFIAFYNNFEKSDLSHSPIVCFTGQGWEIEKSIEKEIDIQDANNGKVQINYIFQKKNGEGMISFYWYQSANRAFSKRGIQKLILFVERIIGERDCNAFVRIHIDVSPKISVEELNSYLISFVQAIYPNLKELFLAE